MNIYLMRHGETDYNVRGLIQGTLDIPLNDNGIKLAELTRDGLRKEGITFAKAYCSPLIRARRTAEIILEGTDTTIIYDDRIAELNFGEGEGVALQEMKTNPIYHNLKNLFDNPTQYVADAKGESFEHLLSRVADFLKQEIYPCEDTCGNVLICCHGGIIRAFLSYLSKKELSDFWGNHQPNCSVNILELKQHEITILEEHRIYYTLPESKKGTIL